MGYGTNIHSLLSACGRSGISNTSRGGVTETYCVERFPLIYGMAFSSHLFFGVLIWLCEVVGAKENSPHAIYGPSTSFSLLPASIFSLDWDGCPSVFSRDEDGYGVCGQEGMSNFPQWSVCATCFVDR